MARRVLGDQPELGLALLADPETVGRLRLADHAGLTRQLGSLLQDPPVPQAPPVSSSPTIMRVSGPRSGTPVLVDEEAGEQRGGEPAAHVRDAAAEDLPVADLAAVRRERPELMVVGGEVVEVAVEREAGCSASRPGCVATRLTVPSAGARSGRPRTRRREGARSGRRWPCVAGRVLRGYARPSAQSRASSSRRRSISVHRRSFSSARAVVVILSGRLAYHPGRRGQARLGGCIVGAVARLAGP